MTPTAFHVPLILAFLLTNAIAPADAAEKVAAHADLVYAEVVG